MPLLRSPVPVLLLTAALVAASPALARPKVGLVLSGGGARGVAHIGVLKVLEELHIPVDYVVGTSMGAIVAGAYAMGNDPAALEARLKTVDWDEVLNDRPPRLERSAYSKANERNNITSQELGLRDAKVQVPRGLNYGQQIEFFFNTLASQTGEVGHFDQLDIPFRAVATDIETGKMVLLERGGIARAMRASMSVPGIFAPVDIGGRALLDGGLVRNLPVDVARGMGADIIIAVNLGTALLKRDKIVSVFGVGQQMLNILTEQNVQASLQQLTPRDVLILPALGEFSAADFENATSTIAIGEAAARAAAPQLQTLALDDGAWRAHLAQRRARHPAPRTVNAVRVDRSRLTHMSEQAVARRVSIQPGVAFDPAQLQADLNALYASGDFQSVNHHFEQDAGGRTLVIEPAEKEWGPNYLRAGVRLSTDLAGESDFTILLSHRWKWLNASGLEWRNDVSLGQVMALKSQLYQPLGSTNRWFLAPSLNLSQTRDNLIVDDQPVATYRIRQRSLGLDIGKHIDSATTVRAGLERGVTSADPSVAVPEFTSQENRIGLFKLELVRDRLDDWVFPAAGTYAFGAARIALPGLGADSRYQRAEAGAESVWAFKQHRLNLGLRGGRIWGEQLPLLELFSLGGFMNMSGYQPRQLVGEGYAYARAIYTRQSELLGLKNVYLGGSLEAGRIVHRFNGPQAGTQFSSAVFGAVDTGVGPFTLGVGMGEGGNHTFYLFFGKP
jgi:NTE family protein